jgi:hypothetical protein
MGALAHNRSQPIMRLPVERVLVTIALENGEPLTGEIFLAPGEPPSSVLDEAEPFVPLALERGVRLVARAMIATLAVAHETELDPDVHEESQRALVRLKNGSSVEGELRWVPSVGYRRTVDLLNLPSRMLVVHGAGCTTFVVKAHVAWVEEC